MNDTIDYKRLLAGSSEEDLVLFQSDLVTSTECTVTDQNGKKNTKTGIFSWPVTLKLMRSLRKVHHHPETDSGTAHTVELATDDPVPANSTNVFSDVAENSVDLRFPVDSVQSLLVQQSHERCDNTEICAAECDTFSECSNFSVGEGNMSDSSRYYDDHRLGESEEDPLFGGGRRTSSDVYIQDTKSRTSRIIVYLTVIILLAAAIGSAVAIGILYGGSASDPEDDSKPRSGFQYENAAVAADAAPCSKIGKDILQKGGGAVDTAIASLLCVGLYNAHSMGIGGGHFMLYYNKAKGSVEYIDAREEAPQAATTHMYTNKSSDASTYGGLAVGVPGEIDGYWLAHQRYGILPWKDLFVPSIELAEEGFTISPALAGAIRSNEDLILRDSSLSEIFTDGNGNILEEGATMYRPQLAETLRQISEGDGYTFYTGKLAENIAAEIQERGGIVTVEDLARYRVKRRVPLSFQLNDLVIYTPPPPASGAVFALIMNMLEGYGFTSESIIDPDEAVLTYHRIIEAFKFAYAKRSALGDEDYVDVKELVANMTSQEFADALRKRINDNKTYDYKYYDPEFEIVNDGGTSHLSIVDQYGNAVAVTSTINTFFGSKVRGNRTGIIYNNEMDDFSKPGQDNVYGVPPSEANFIVPGKRPLSSMTPVIALDQNGDVRLVIGASGGTRITTAVSLVTMETLWFDSDLEAGVERRRLHHQLMPLYPTYEVGFREDVLNGLRTKGQNVTETTSEAVVQVIRRLEDNWLDAYCDKRKDGIPAGF